MQDWSLLETQKRRRSRVINRFIRLLDEEAESIVSEVRPRKFFINVNQTDAHHGSCLTIRLISACNIRSRQWRQACKGNCGG